MNEHLIEPRSLFSEDFSTEALITVINVNSPHQPSHQESEDEGFSENSCKDETGQQSQSFQSLTIKGPSGSVRGKSQRVRQHIQFYDYDIVKKNLGKFVRDYVSEESNLCVLYVTTLSVVRNTFENCRKVKGILSLHLIRYDERDIYINEEFKCELLERCGSIVVPSLFIGGRLIGGADAIEKLNECGQLINLLATFKMNNPQKTCPCCGDAKFIPCEKCNGSRKSHVRHFSCDSITLRCSHCNATGIVRCLLCYRKEKTAETGC